MGHGWLWNAWLVAHTKSIQEKVVMLIEEYMTPQPTTVDENTSIIDAAALMKEKKFRRFPVVRGDELVGIVTDRDIRSAAPSQVISFDAEERTLMPELHSLLARIKVGEIMSTGVVTAYPRQTIVTAALLMLKYRISGLPVVDSSNELVGIITEGDIFKVLVDFSGVSLGNTVLAFRLEDRPASIKEAADAIREHDGRLASILTSYDSTDPGFRKVYFRIRDLPSEKLRALQEGLQKNFELLYVVRDEVEKL
jgi:acetoin utilization protein AcuB